MDGDHDLNAAVYVLGALEGKERSAFLRKLETSEELQAAVQLWQMRLTQLEAFTETVDPDASDWAAVARRLGLMTSGTRSVHQGNAVWIQYEPGVDIKYLQVDPVSAARTALLRMRPGSSVSSHQHDQTEHCVVLDGDVVLDQHRLARGDLHIAPAGTLHSKIHSEGGCLLLLLWEPRTTETSSY